MGKFSERLKTRSPPPAGEMPLSRKEQYEILFRYYTEESDRYEALNKRAAAYLSIIGAVSVFTAFKSDVISKSVLTHPVPITLAVFALVALLACVLAVAYSMRVTEYRTPVRPKELVLTAEKEGYTSDDIHSVLLAGLIESIEWNRAQNNARATALQVSLWFAAIAVFLAVVINVTLLFLTTKEISMSKYDSQKSNVPTPAPSSPSKTSLADLLNNNRPVPVKKYWNDDSPQKPPSAPVK